MKKPCKKCGLMIKGKMPYCIYCIAEFRKAGTCIFCGEKPIAPKAKNGMQSKYCVECKQSAEKAVESMEQNERYRKFRGTDARENTYETKYGRD